MKSLERWVVIATATLELWGAVALGQEVTSTNAPKEVKENKSTRDGDMVVLSGLEWNEDGGTLYFDAVAGVEYEIQYLAWNGIDAWADFDHSFWMSETDGKAAVEVNLPWGACFRVCTRTSEGEMVVSSNAMCLLRSTIPAGGWMPVSMPFDNPGSEDGRYRFGETGFARGLPVGSSVLFWDVVKQKWNGGIKSAFGWDPAESNRVLQVGEGFCVRNGGEEVVDIPVTGEVPSESSLVRAYAGDSMWSSMAHPYPVETPFGDTDLAMQLPQASSVAFWDSGAQAWSMGMKSAKGWSAGSANHVLGVGEAFFIRSASGDSWVASKPYEWP